MLSYGVGELNHPEIRRVSLITFHRILIATGILFCVGYSGYELVEFTKMGGTRPLVLGVVFFLLGCGLSYYLWRLSHFLGYRE